MHMQKESLHLPTRIVSEILQSKPELWHWTTNLLSISYTDAFHFLVTTTAHPFRKKWLTGTTKSQFMGILQSHLRQKLQTTQCNWSWGVEEPEKLFLQKLSRDPQGPLYTLPSQHTHFHVQGRESLQLSNLLGVGEGTCELQQWEGMCSPFTNTSWTTLGGKRCETVDWLCWLLGARCAGPTRMLLRNSVTPGAWEQHRNSTEKNTETESRRGRGKEGMRERRKWRERLTKRKREREICYLAFH